VIGFIDEALKSHLLNKFQQIPNSSELLPPDINASAVVRRIYFISLDIFTNFHFAFLG
jgi:hypothetical protein